MALAACGAPAHADSAFQAVRLPTGVEIEYAVVTPPDFSPAKEYPALLALPPGDQTPAMVRWGLRNYWEAEAQRRGYLVFSPAAPPDAKFFEGGALHLVALCEHLLAAYPVAGNRFHVAGVSNGGLSAFAVATLRPELFRSLTVLPGYPPDAASWRGLVRLRGMRVNMIVGERDEQWLQRMLETKAELERLQVATDFEIVPGAGHEIERYMGANSGEIFDRLPTDASTPPGP